MRKELEQRIINRWPAWFDVEGNICATLMPRGFQHGDGWFDLVWKMCEDLEPLVPGREATSAAPFQVFEVKEKFGSLRVYVGRANKAIQRRIEEAGSESKRTCEICGKAGFQRNNGGWINTRCYDHAPSGQIEV